MARSKVAAADAAAAVAVMAKQTWRNGAKERGSEEGDSES